MKPSSPNKHLPLNIPGVEPKTIVFTGGHHNSALIIALRLRSLGYRVIWIGHKYSMAGDINPSAEFDEVTTTGIEFHELKAGKFHRTYHPIKLLRIPYGFAQAFLLLRSIKPDLIVTFGSYLAVPVACCGWIMRIPVITHEQTLTPTLANKLISKLAKITFLTFPASKRYYPQTSAVVIGLPIGFSPHLRAKPKKPPLLYIRGGKQGAHVLNEAVFGILEELLEKYQVVHQTGSSSVYHDFDRARIRWKGLPEILKRRYRVESYIRGTENIRLMVASSLFISRSGAHTVYEAGILGVPSLFVPYPGRTSNEQVANAQVLKKAGAAEILEQSDLSPRRLLEEIERMVNNKEYYKLHAEKAKSQFPADAQEKMVRSIVALLA
jgi:UDP-N-acetylglucosamine--N-acetylmuramyl-(pentapeptide) pyrophosphoryl-undecaprenol N-acetylglucosamine transferase